MLTNLLTINLFCK